MTAGPSRAAIRVGNRPPMKGAAAAWAGQPSVGDGAGRTTLPRHRAARSSGPLAWKTLSDSGRSPAKVAAKPVAGRAPIGVGPAGSGRLSNVGALALRSHPNCGCRVGSELYALPHVPCRPTRLAARRAGTIPTPCLIGRFLQVFHHFPSFPTHRNPAAVFWRRVAAPLDSGSGGSDSCPAASERPPGEEGLRLAGRFTRLAFPAKPGVGATRPTPTNYPTFHARAPAAPKTFPRPPRRPPVPIRPKVSI